MCVCVCVCGGGDRLIGKLWLRAVFGRGDLLEGFITSMV